MSSSTLDQAALERLYLRLEGPVYNVVYRWVWDSAEAADIVQEAFARLWKIRSRVDMERVDALLYKIALNLASNRRRALKIRRWVGLGEAIQPKDPKPDGQAQLESKEREEKVRKAVEALPKKMREVVVMAEFADMGYAQIAQVLGIPEGTVASRRNAALKRMRAHLEDWQNAAVEK
jgi:RNA polymerase sigma-70 factor (ECF subfamily)